MDPAPAPSPSLATSRGAIAWVLVAWALAALPGVVDAPIGRAAQARAVAVARTMADTGDLVVPRYNDEPRLKKPPLQSWVQAATMAVAGTREPWGAALGSWLAGALFALGPLLLGRALGRPAAGLLGSLLLCASRATAWWGSSPEHDVAFAGWVALSLAFLARALSARGRPRDSLAAGLACGAALLVKGPFALAFVLGTAIAARWWARRTGAKDAGRPRLRWVPLVAGSLLPGAAWLVAVAVRLGGVAGVFEELRVQTLGGANAHVRGGIAYVVWYFGVVPAWSLPWSALGLPALAWALLVRRRLGAGPRPLDGLSFAGIAFAVSFVALTLTPGKQDHYALPLLPPLFLLFAAAIEDLSARFPRLARAGPPTVVGLALAFAASRAVGAARSGGVDLLPFLVPALLAVVPAALVIGRAHPRGGARAWVAAGLSACLSTGIAARLDSLRHGATDDYADAVAALAAPLDSSLPVVGYARGEREAFDVVALRLDRPFRRVKDVAAVRALLDAGRGFHLLALDPEREDLSALTDRLDLVATLSPRRPESRRDRVLLYRSR